MAYYIDISGHSEK